MPSRRNGANAAALTLGAEEAIHERLRRSGGRLTDPTRVLVAIFVGTDEHLTADDLIAEVHRRSPGTAPSTVYRLLQRLEQLRIIEHVHSGSGAAFYHLSERGHAHLVCTGCGRVIDVPDAAFEQLSNASRAAYDFTIEPHHSAVLGQCGSCMS